MACRRLRVQGWEILVELLAWLEGKPGAGKAEKIVG
jgi:hypothetical protein